MSPTGAFWGKEIAVEQIGGVPFRMYSDRPRRIDRLLAFADCWGARPYIVQGERTVTFAGLRRAARKGAADRRDRGRTRRTRIAVRLEQPRLDPQFLGLRADRRNTGAGQCLVEQRRIGAYSNLLRPVIALADAGAAKLPSNCRRAPWGVDEGSAGVPPANPHGAAPASFDENAAAVIIFTSGTAGRAKAVVLAHRGLLATLQMPLHVTRRLPYRPDAAAGEVCLHTGPLFHTAALARCCAASVGNTVVPPRGRFDPAEALQRIERYEVSRWNAVPTMATRLLDHPDMGRRRLRSLRALTLGGAPVMRSCCSGCAPYCRNVEARIPPATASAKTAGRRLRHPAPTPPCGPARAAAHSCVELEIASRPGLPDGEIRVRSPTQMFGYFGDEEQPIDGDGWLRTGDLGRIDDEGHLWVTGRCKDIIIRGGENIAPAAVERALVAIPGVSDAAVFGVPHPISARKSRPSSWLWASLRASGSKSSCAQAWHHLRCRAAGGSRLSRSRSTKRARSTRRHCLPDCERSAGARPRRRRHDGR